MENYLQQGIAAAKAGDKPRAFDLLMRATEDPASSEYAWLWLSSVVNDDPERLYCINNALRINPNNDTANRAAAMLRQKGIFPSIPAYPQAQRAASVQTSAFQQPSPSASSPVNFAAPAQTQAVSASLPASRPQQQTGYEADRSKQELSGFYRYAVTELANKKSGQAVEKLLVSQGASSELAKTVVKDAQYALRKVRRGKYKSRMLRGLALTVIGVIITCVTYAFADSLGGKFVLFYGAIIFGVIDFVAGLVGWLANI